MTTPTHTTDAALTAIRVHAARAAVFGQTVHSPWFDPTRGDTYPRWAAPSGHASQCASHATRDASDCSCADLCCAWCDQMATHAIGTLDQSCDWHHTLWFGTPDESRIAARVFVGSPAVRTVRVTLSPVRRVARRVVSHSLTIALLVVLVALSAVWVAGALGLVAITFGGLIATLATLEYRARRASRSGADA